MSASRGMHERLPAMEEIHVVGVVRDLVDDRREEPEVHEAVVFLDHVLVRAVAALQVAAARRLDPEPHRQLGDRGRPGAVGPEDSGEAPHVAELPSIHPIEYSRPGSAAARSGGGAHDLHPAEPESGVEGRQDPAPPSMEPPSRPRAPEPCHQPVSPGRRVGGHRDPPTDAHVLRGRAELGQESGQRVVVPEPGALPVGCRPGSVPRPSEPPGRRPVQPPVGRDLSRSRRRGAAVASRRSPRARPLHPSARRPAASA